MLSWVTFANSIRSFRQCTFSSRTCAVLASDNSKSIHRVVGGAVSGACASTTWPKERKVSFFVPLARGVACSFVISHTPAACHLVLGLEKGSSFACKCFRRVCLHVLPACGFFSKQAACQGLLKITCLHCITCWTINTALHHVTVVTVRCWCHWVQACLSGASVWNGMVTRGEWHVGGGPKKMFLGSTKPSNLFLAKKGFLVIVIATFCEGQREARVQVPGRK